MRFPRTPAYSQESEDETRTLDYSGCLIAGEPQTLRLRVTASTFSTPSPATFQVTSEDGQRPVVTFSPATVSIERKSVQAFDVALSFSLLARLHPAAQRRRGPPRPAHAGRHAGLHPLTVRGGQRLS